MIDNFIIINILYVKLKILISKMTSMTSYRIGIDIRDYDDFSSETLHLSFYTNASNENECEVKSRETLEKLIFNEDSTINENFLEELTERKFYLTIATFIDKNTKTRFNDCNEFGELFEWFENSFPLYLKEWLKIVPLNICEIKKEKLYFELSGHRE